jgi:hypothetical protein
MLVVVSGVSYGVLDRYDSDPGTTGTDGAVWVSLARDCVEFGHCFTSGARASYMLATGAFWVDVLMLVDIFHGTSLAERAMVLGLLSGTLGVLCVVLWRWLRPFTAIAATLVILRILEISPEPGRLWNASAAFFPCGLAFGAMLVCAWTGRVRFLLVAALFVVLAMAMHMVALSTVPALLAVALMACPSPWRALLLSIAAVALGNLIVAANETFLNAAAFAQELPAALMALAVVIVGARLLRPVFLRAGRPVRSIILILWMIIPWVGVVVAISRHVFVLASPFGLLADRYGTPAVAPTAILLAISAEGLLATVAARVHEEGWLANTVRLVLCGWLVAALVEARTHEGAFSPWSREDTRTLTQRLSERGWKYEALVEHLQTPVCWELLSGIVMYSSPPEAMSSVHAPLRQMRVWLLDDSVLRDHRLDGVSIVPLRQSRSAVLSEIDSWLAMDDMQYCQGAGEARRCAPAHTPAGPNSGHDFTVTFRPQLWYPPGARDPTVTKEGLLVPLVTTAETRDFSVFSSTDCPWNIEAVEGAAFERLSPTSVRMHGPASGPAKLLIGRDIARCGSWTPLIPCVRETLPSDSPVLYDHDLSVAGAQPPLPPRGAQ